MVLGVDNVTVYFWPAPGLIVQSSSSCGCAPAGAAPTPRATTIATTKSFIQFPRLVASIRCLELASYQAAHPPLETDSLLSPVGLSGLSAKRRARLRDANPPL